MKTAVSAIFVGMWGSFLLDERNRGRAIFPSLSLVEGGL